MKTPFRLDEHPRRPQPLAPPPDQYFHQLPLRVMQRVQAPEPTPGFSWLSALPAPLRMALATSVVLGAFVGSFWLSESALAPAATAPDTLAAVPRHEMVEYLLASEQRLSLTDLAELPAVERILPETYLQASPDEVQEVLDAQPTEDTYL
ncbi:hypothetical protein J0X19_09275 [Hymenobacter sp. BT186]|uniref:Uncharacterized protein n=1 Tax=Hymenobacter telluris TaxID=2816474 RepID=A0A939EYB1_9BACT|nr:hypothetical protein [Hymenobacter telluris]MBO0358133.1 hypothetical protein [Hymenobacter telluris]MBW3374160.1 hypothetical protein [Hymenobacter norwichensis]